MSLIDKQHYPALRDNPLLMHFDASAAFPIHEKVVNNVANSMTYIVGTPGKADYDWAHTASSLCDEAREAIAECIGAKPHEIFFTHSATEGLEKVTRVYRSQYAEGAVYAPEDHLSITRVASYNEAAKMLVYDQAGVYDTANILSDASRNILYTVQVHHLYGGDNPLHKLRSLYPNSFMIVDASQAIGRTAVDVQQLGCDALLFSSQKVGGIAGAGVLYIAEKHHGALLSEKIEPNTLPLLAIVSIRHAVEVIQDVGINIIDLYLAKLTERFIYRSLEYVSGIVFSKGPACAEYSCGGNGIISFSIDGYSSQDVAMYLNDQHINVRAGDHCVDGNHVDKDVVRISFHAYISEDDIDRFVDVLATM